MKNIKISSFIFILIIIFLIIDFIGYRLLHSHITSNHEKDVKILFHEIKSQTSDILSNLLHEYSMHKEEIVETHKVVLEYMNHHDLNVNLDEIQERINQGSAHNLYDIYITDKNYVIRNSTNKDEIGFDLSFAKSTFEKHKAENTIGCSAPIREKKGNNFLSYTDSYLSKNGDDRIGILQVSYTYKNTEQDIARLQKNVGRYPSIKDAKAYSVGSSGFIYEIILKENVAYKPDMEMIAYADKEARTVSKKLNHYNLSEENFVKKGIHYKALYMSTNSPISNDIKIVYSILFDESDFYDRLSKLNILMTIISIMGIVGIIIISKVRHNEIMLSNQDKFVQSAMHEINTPLSIISLNNELRQLQYGNDKYGEEIDSALKVLHNSYSSMSFIVTKDKLTYPIETFDLSTILEERIDFFQTIAKSNEKKIISNINSHCRVEMSLIELTRLIDNNLSNAVKYSYPGTDINVVLENDILSFHNYGKAIQNKKKIFGKYFRENTIIGGYGLGLSIIRDITNKYSIDMKFKSHTLEGTTFIYIFNCQAST